MYFQKMQEHEIDLIIPAQLRSKIPSEKFQKLANLLQEPIRFQPATDFTKNDEERLASTRRSRTAQQTTNKSSNRDYIKDSKKTSSMSISSKWQGRFSRSRGLSNSGNRCYRNSVLQALLHIPKIVNWMEIAHVGCPVNRCTLCSFKKLCARYWNQPGNPRAMTPYLNGLDCNLRLTKTFRNINWQFSKQNDAYLYLLHLLNALLETNSSLSNVTNSLLGHSTITKKICSQCRLKSVRHTVHEQERILQVAWGREKSLDQILRDREFNNDVYDDLRCDRCDAKRQHPYQKRLCIAPEVLIIHLGRFEPTRKGTTFKKKQFSWQDKIIFHKSLDLTAFTAKNTRLRYSLQAVVHHKGGLNCGHYIADTKGPGGTWERIDDESVTRSNVEEALDPSPLTRRTSDPWTPYLLFYVKIDDSSGQDKERPTMKSESQAPLPVARIKEPKKNELMMGRVVKPKRNGKRSRKRKDRRK